MRILARVIVGLVLAVPYAALLGWLKTLYFLKPFGVSPALTLTGPGAALFESWYVVQNLVYFALIVWLVVQTRRFVLAIVAALYALVPLATHYAFLLYPNSVVRWCVDHQHAWLKLVPLVLLSAVVLAAARGRRVDPRWRHGATGWVLFGIVVGSWGLSAAKHLGSYDAERVLHRPVELLPGVELAWKGTPRNVEAGRLLFSDARTVVVAVFPEVPPWNRGLPVVHMIPRDELALVSVSPATNVQPGGQYF